MATRAAIVDEPLPYAAGEDSHNLMPLLLGQPERPATMHHSIECRFAIRGSDGQLVLCRGSGDWSPPEKNAPPDAPPAQIYNMRDAPREERNPYRDRPEVAAPLAATLDAFHRHGRNVPA